MFPIQSTKPPKAGNTRKKTQKSQNQPPWVAPPKIGRRPLKIDQESPPFFNAKSVEELEFSGEQAKSICGREDFLESEKRPLHGQELALLKAQLGEAFFSFIFFSANRHLSPQNRHLPCPSFPWLFGFPWLVLSKQFPRLDECFLCIFQGFRGFGRSRKSLVEPLIKESKSQGMEDQGERAKPALKCRNWHLTEGPK